MGYFWNVLILLLFSDHYLTRFVCEVEMAEEEARMVEGAAGEVLPVVLVVVLMLTLLLPLLAAADDEEFILSFRCS